MQRPDGGFLTQQLLFPVPQDRVGIHRHARVLGIIHQRIAYGLHIRAISTHLMICLLYTSPALSIYPDKEREQPQESTTKRNARSIYVSGVNFRTDTVSYTHLVTPFENPEVMAMYSASSRVPVCPVITILG